MEIEKIVEELTLEEKIGMIHGAELFATAGVERLGIPPLRMSDGPMGVRNEFEPDNWKTIGLSDDYVTYLPCNSALASTWNRELAFDTGSVLGEEARGRGKDVILAPGVNIKRSPLCGRNFEYFSEDPYLTKEMAVPYIRGVQEWDVAACVKHFAANNQETQRLNVEVEIEEEALREIYLPAFHDAVKKAGSHTIMGAYNMLYGEHCCQSDFLLKKILREEWQYDGVVVSDWGGVHDTERAANSQLDIEMSVTYDFDDYHMANPLLKKVQAGEIPESVIDEKIRRILRLMERLHMLDGKRKTGSYNTPGHREAAHRAARESIVLLKNERNLLPLKRENMKRILLIGENAQCIHSNGGGSAEIKALYEISPLMGIKTCLGGNVRVDYAPGYCREEKREESEQNWQEASLENGGGATDKEEQAVSLALQKKRKALKEQALKLAEDISYDAVLFVGGLNHDHDSEGNDRADMGLPYGQDELIGELFSRRPDMIV
ncbi:MAG: glycoside hydrolase family 3 protein, partial [Lachnospiraceae bacterium]|nr:glycoside hydrolase family 3 protein [Lachnospiraceae bacterium]